MTVDKFGRMSDAGAVYTEGVSLRYINNNFLRRDGTNTATGSLNMTGNTLLNVSNPMNAQDVATKNYVDTNSSSDKVSKSGDTMTGHLNMSGNLIIGLPTTYPPITYIGDEATSWDQTVGLVQDAASILVDKSGDTMTGDLDMSGNRVTNVPYAPANTSDAANAAYVIQGDLDVEQKTVLRDGTQAMTGNLNMDDHFINNLTNPVNAQDAATKNYVDTNKVSKSGDTMTGELFMDGNLIKGLPTHYPHIYSGDTVPSWAQVMGIMQELGDASVMRDGTQAMTGNLDMSGNRVMNIPYAPVNTSDAANAAYVIQGDLDVEQKTVLRDGTQAMTGNLNMDDHFINNLTNPVNAQDAATKNYVDQRKPIISIHAEESEPIVVGEYQWSFGNGATGNGFATCGYVMMSSGRLLRMGLSSVKSSGGTDNQSIVAIVVNGVVDNNFAVTKPIFEYSGNITFTPTRELSQGDVINFRSLTSDSIAAFSIVCAIIELDM